MTILKKHSEKEEIISNLYLLYELGIHCGSLAQAEHINDLKYKGSGDIYKITVTNFNASEAASDFEAWNSVEAVFEILTRGFGTNISKQDILADYRSGKFQKDYAAEYISDYVGSDKLIVAYNNVVELPEEDIIILNDSCIKSIEKMEDYEMKRWKHSQKEIIEIELDIDISPKEIIQSSSILDTKSNEYQSFIKGMVMAFEDAGYELYNDPTYTHQSNQGSQSWYYTFLRIEDYVEIRIVVNVRISDHFNKDRPWGTANERRQKYTTKVRDQLEQEYQVSKKPMRVPVEIIFDDDNYDSYTDALFAIHDKIDDIEEAYKKWAKRHQK